MSLLVDTSVWIDSFNSKIKTPEKDLLQQLVLDDYPIYLCPVIFQEVLQRIREDKVFSKIRHIFQHYSMIQIDIMDVTNLAIDLYRDLRKKGITIRKSVDCLIASYAILADIHLLHNDKDFIQIAKGSELKILNA